MSEKIVGPSNVGGNTHNEVTTTLEGDKVGLDVRPISAGNLLEGLSFDYITATYPNTTSEVYTYKTGGVSGTTVATITVTYTDSTKEVLSSVART